MACSDPKKPTTRLIEPPRKYLVTGGCGFIGSHLCQALLNRGHSVRVLDDLSAGSLANLPDGADLQIGDVSDALAVNKAAEDVAGCFHLAAIASVDRCSRDWLGTHRVNLVGTLNVLDAVRSMHEPGAVPVVYASSAAVYGDCAGNPLTESAQTMPLSAYGADKLGCEQHARVASLTHGIPTVGLRFFNVFGPRQDPASPYAGVISLFCDRLRRSEPLDVFGDGRQTRDYIHVSDVVAALISAMACASVDAEIFNVCTGRSITVLELAMAIADLCQTRPIIRMRPTRAGEVRHSLGSPELARQKLGLKPALELRTGLVETLAWMSEGASHRHQS